MKEGIKTCAFCGKSMKIGEPIVHRFDCQLFEPKPTEPISTLNCDKCGKPYYSPTGFPLTQLCPECNGTEGYAISRLAESEGGKMSEFEYTRMNGYYSTHFQPSYPKPESRLLTDEELLEMGYDKDFEGKLAIAKAQLSKDTEHEQAEIKKLKDIHAIELQMLGEELTDKHQQRIEGLLQRIGKALPVLLTTVSGEPFLPWWQLLSDEYAKKEA